MSGDLYGRAIEPKHWITWLGLLAFALILYPFVISSGWKSSSDVHAVLEGWSAFTALATGLIIMIHYFATGSWFFLIISLGFVLQGGEDMVHATFSFTRIWGTERENIFKFVPGTYVLGRFFLVACILLAFMKKDKFTGEARRARISFLVLGWGIVLSTISTIFVIKSDFPLPAFIIPGRIISRPEDFAVTLIYLPAIAIYIRAFRKEKNRTPFLFSIICSLIYGFVAGLYMVHSQGLYDAQFDMAHIFKIFSYLFPTLGIGFGTFGMYRNEAKHAMIMALSMQKERELAAATAAAAEEEKKRAEELAVAVRQLRTSEEQLMAANQQMEANQQALKTANLQLTAAKEVAEKANRAKSVFLANMSHELRTPLNTVLGFSHLLKESLDTTAEQREIMDIITVSAEHLLNLINNVLDMSKIESGRVNLEESPLDLHQLIQELKSLIYAKAKGKELYFVVEQAPDLPSNIAVDGAKLRQVLINLIGNAIKYTEQGGIILRAMVAKKENGGRLMVRFEVKDTGRGISREDQKRIFSPFVQLGEQPPAEAGSGLGLAISKQYVELMGGSIGVESERGKGSVFYFELPVTVLPAVPLPAARRGRVLGLAKGQPRLRLLIVEDEPGNRLLLRKLIEPLGFEFREASNGREAIEIFEKWRPDLIWMDIRMPVMDGLEAARRIKDADVAKKTKIVAVTAHALKEERREIMAAGFDDFIRKPYHYAEILDALTKNLGARFIYEKEAAPAVVMAHLSPTDLARLPDDLLNALEQALIHIDAAGISRAIEEFRVHDAALADALAADGRTLQYGRLLKLVKAARAEIKPKEAR